MKQKVPPKSQKAILLSQLLKVCSSRMDTALASHLKSKEIGLPQFEIMELLYENQNMKPIDISEALNASPASITYLVDRLIESEIVTREPSPTDRRSYQIQLTNKGQKQVEEVLPEYGKIFSGFFASMSSTEQNQMIKTLTAISQNLQKDHQK